MADRQRLIETLIDLIRIDSPSGEEDAMDREVSARLERLGLNIVHRAFDGDDSFPDPAGAPQLYE